MSAKKKTNLAPASMPESLPPTAAAEIPIVGLGASAGGLAACESFFSDNFSVTYNSRR